MRLGDLDALKEIFLQDRCGNVFLPKQFVISTIDNAPTVEDCSLEIARKSLELGRRIGKLEGKGERPQGEWIDYDNTFYKCPDCGYLLEKCCPQCQNKVILPKGGAEE